MFPFSDFSNKRSTFWFSWIRGVDGLNFHHDFWEITEEGETWIRSSAVSECLVSEYLLFQMSENYINLIFVGANQWPSIKKTCLCAKENNVQRLVFLRFWKIVLRQMDQEHHLWDSQPCLLEDLNNKFPARCLYFCNLIIV